MYLCSYAETEATRYDPDRGEYRTPEAETETCRDCGRIGWRSDWPGKGCITASKHAGHPVCDECEEERDERAADSAAMA
jgi:hypothetical protein